MLTLHLKRIEYEGEGLPSVDTQWRNTILFYPSLSLQVSSKRLNLRLQGLCAILEEFFPKLARESQGEFSSDGMVIWKEMRVPGMTFYTNSL